MYALRSRVADKVYKTIYGQSNRTLVALGGWFLVIVEIMQSSRPFTRLNHLADFTVSRITTNLILTRSTWIQFYTPETKKQSEQWSEDGPIGLKFFRILPFSRRKVLSTSTTWTRTKWLQGSTMQYYWVPLDQEKFTLPPWESEIYNINFKGLDELLLYIMKTFKPDKRILENLAYQKCVQLH